MVGSRFGSAVVTSVAVAAASIGMLDGTAAADAGVILVSQNRYIHSWGEQRQHIGNALVSSFDNTTPAPASGFDPFNASLSTAGQNSTLGATGIDVSGTIAASSSSGVSTYSWTAGDSFFEAVFDVVDAPQPYHLVSSFNAPTLSPQRLSGPGGTIISFPSNGTLDGALSVGRWTMSSRAVYSGQGASTFSATYGHAAMLSFVPEPTGAAVVLLGTGGATVIRRRRSRR